MLKLLPLAIATAVASGQLLANEQQNNSRFALAGYGDVKYEDSKLMDTSAVFNHSSNILGPGRVDLQC